jgi:origin recognition complex subunit 5
MPKAFPLDRLLAIFYFIVGGTVPMLLEVQSSLCGLAERGLVTRTTGLAKLDMPKFRCPLSLDTASIISRAVNFDLSKYLISTTQ